MPIIAHTKKKYAAESRLYAMDFARVQEIQDGETLTGTPTVVEQTGDGALTIGAPSISGSLVQFRVSAGTADTRYTLRCTVLTSGGSTLVGEGELSLVG